MAISTGIFKTPTGPVYDPARDIERGFDKTAGIITGFMERKAQDYDQQQEMFGQVASRIGEIEATLQQNYAGMQQQAIDSTREWLKQNIKKGTRANDPDFQMGLGQRVGAIRAAMGNADKIRQQIDLQIKQLEANPYMDYNGKKAALAELFAMSSNPDILIDKDPVTKMNAVTNKYIDPELVFAENYRKLSTTGKIQKSGINKVGDEVVEEMVGNELIDQNTPFDEQGLPNLKLDSGKPEDVAKALDIYRRDGALASVIDEEIKRNPRYAALGNNEAAITEAMRDGFKRIASSAVSSTIRKTKRELDDIAEQKSMQRSAYESDMAYKAAQTRKMNAEVEAANKAGIVNDAIVEDSKKFAKGFEEGDNSVLQPYAAFVKKSGMNNVRWDKNVYLPKVQSIDAWNALSPEQRKEALRTVGQNPDNLVFYTGGKETGKPVTFEGTQAYNLFDRERKKKGVVTGIVYTNNDGEEVRRSLDEMGGLSGTFNMFTDFRRSGKSYIPVPSDPFGQGQSGQPSVPATPGFTLNATQLLQQQ
jgi:hypothetical protein